MFAAMMMFIHKQEVSTVEEALTGRRVTQGEVIIPDLDTWDV